MEKVNLDLINERHLKKVDRFNRKHRLLSAQLKNFEEGVLTLNINVYSFPKECVKLGIIFSVAQAWLDHNPELKNAWRFSAKLRYIAPFGPVVKTEMIEGPLLCYN